MKRMVIVLMAIMALGILFTTQDGKSASICKNKRLAYDQFVMVCTMAGGEADKEFCHCIFFNFNTINLAKEDCSYGIEQVGNIKQNMEVQRVCGHLEQY